MQRMRLLIKSLVALLIAIPCAYGFASVAHAANPTITLSPAIGPPTSLVVVKGAGFGANEAVDVYFDLTDMVLAATSGTGAFSVSFRIPRASQPGTHYVTGVGRTSALSAQRRFTVSTSWAQYGFNPAHLGLNPFENTLTSSNVSQLGALWAANSGFDSLSVANGFVYAGSQDDHVYALNTATGKVKWSVTTGGHVVGTPAVSGGTVYFGSEDGKVYAVKATTGAAVWTDDLSVLEPSGFDSSPTVTGGVVYIGGQSGTVYALSASSGFSNWAFPTGGAASSPAVSAGRVFVSSHDGNVYAVNAANGSKLWQTAVFGLAVDPFPDPVVANGAVYVAEVSGIVALDASSGHQLWAVSVSNSYVGMPTVVNGVLYFGAGSEGGYPFLYAVNASSQSIIWDDVTFPCAYGTVFNQPVLANGVLYDTCGSSPSLIFAVNPADGSQLWAANSGWGGTMCGPTTVADGTVDTVCSDGTLYSYALPAGSAAVSQQPDPSRLNPNVWLSPSR